MNPIDAIRGWLTDISGRVRGTTSDDSAGAEAPSTERSTAAQSPPLDEGLSKAEIVMETGMTPEAYLLQLVAAEGGKLPQQAIVDATGWSTVAVSRTLSAMEADGQLTRVQVGREKLVFLPAVDPTEISPEDLTDG